MALKLTIHEFCAGRTSLAELFRKYYPHVSPDSMPSIHPTVHERYNYFNPFCPDPQILVDPITIMRLSSSCSKEPQQNPFRVHFHHGESAYRFIVVKGR